MTPAALPDGLPLVVGAFVAGLLGSAHCVGMCGGVVAGLSLAGERSNTGFQPLYHLGRITTYTALGAALAWGGEVLGGPATLRGGGRWVLVAADGFVISIGLGGAGLLPWGNLLDLEFPGLVNRLGRGVRRLRALPRGFAAFPLGLVLGFLPCGFLYSVLLNAALTGSPTRGAAIMAGFGLGTAPALLAFGGVTGWLTQRGRTWMLRAAGIAVALMGSYNLWKHLGMFFGL